MMTVPPGFKLVEEEATDIPRGFKLVGADQTPAEALAMQLGEIYEPANTRKKRTALESAGKAFSDTVGDRIGFDTPARRESFGGNVPVLGATPIPDTLAAVTNAGSALGDLLLGGTTAAADLAGSGLNKVFGGPVDARRDVKALTEFAGLFSANAPASLARATAQTTKKVTAAQKAAQLKTTKAVKSIGKAADEAIIKVAIGGDEPAVVAQRLVDDALKLDKIDPTQVTSGTLIQRGGENLRALARTAGSRIGQSRELIEQYKNGVVAQQFDRVKNAAEKTLGGKNGYFDEFEGLIDQRSSSAAPLYAEAFEQVVPVNKKLKTLLQRPSGQSALKRAKKIAQEQGEVFDDLGDTISVRDLDRIKRGLDDAIEKFRDPVTGRLPSNNNLNAIQGTRGQFLQQIESLSPTYKAARDSFSGPSQSLDFLQRGRQFMRRNPEQIKSVMRNGGESDRAFYRSGALRGIFDEMDRIGANQNVIRAKLTAPRFRQQISALFDDKKAADNFVDTLIDERDRFMRAQSVVARSGSQTQQRGSDASFFTRVADLMDLTSGNPFGMSRSIAGKIRGAASDKAQQQVFDEVAKIVTQEKVPQ